MWQKARETRQRTSSAAVRFVDVARTAGGRESLMIGSSSSTGSVGGSLGGVEAMSKSEQMSARAQGEFVRRASCFVELTEPQHLTVVAPQGRQQPPAGPRANSYDERSGAGRPSAGRANSPPRAAPRQRTPPRDMQHTQAAARPNGQAYPVSRLPSQPPAASSSSRPPTVASSAQSVNGTSNGASTKGSFTSRLPAGGAAPSRPQQPPARSTPAPAPSAVTAAALALTNGSASQLRPQVPVTDKATLEAEVTALAKWVLISPQRAESPS